MSKWLTTIFETQLQAQVLVAATGAASYVDRPAQKHNRPCKFDDLFFLGFAWTRKRISRNVKGRSLHYNSFMRHVRKKNVGRSFFVRFGTLFLCYCGFCRNLKRVTRNVTVCPAKHAPANHMSPVNVKITSTWHTVGSMCMQRSVTCWNEKMPAWRQSRLRNVWCHVSEIIPKLRVVFANFRHWRPRSIARSKIYTVPGPLKITLLALLGHPHHRSKWEHIRPNLHKLLSLRPHKFLHIGHLQAKTSQQ